jgi:hypothetical protein
MGLLSRFLSSRTETSKGKQSARQSRPALEALEDRTLPATVFVVPVSQAANNASTFHTLQDALPAAGAGGLITIEPGAVADFNTDITQGNLTIQGDPNVPSAILPAYNLSVDASGVSLKNLHLNFVSVSAAINSLTIFRSTVSSIFIQGGPSANGNNLITQNLITSSVTITGNTTLGVASNDRITNNIFTGFPDTMLSITADNGAIIQGNIFTGGGAITTTPGGANVTGAPQTAIAINGGVNVLVASNTIKLPGNSIPAGVTGVFQGISVSKFDPATAGLPAGTPTAAPVVNIQNNTIDTGRGTGLAITAVPGVTGDRDTQVLVQGNDFHNNAIGVSYTGAGGGSITTDLGGGILGSLGGNNFRGFTASGTPGSAAIVLSNVGAGAQLFARNNLFPGNGQSASAVVFASAGAIDVSSPLTNNQAFVQVLYNDFLGRTGTIGELNFWVNLLRINGQAAVVQGIFDSAESLGRIVDGFYLKYLGRASDSGGRAFWVNLIQGGTSLESVQAGFISSPEFISSNDSDYVQGLYRTFLNRTGSSAELAVWYANLQQPGGLNITAQGFARSAENRRNFVQSIFTSYFHRQGSPADLNTWANNPNDLLSIANQMLSTPEFLNNG